MMKLERPEAVEKLNTFEWPSNNEDLMSKY